MSLADDIRHALPPPHPAGRPFLLGGLIVIVLGLLLAHWLAWLGLLFTLFCLYFFRDPERVPPGRAGALLAPGRRPRGVRRARAAAGRNSGWARRRAGASRSFCRCWTCT